jgi:hypothetical protein
MLSIVLLPVSLSRATLNVAGDNRLSNFARSAIRSVIEVNPVPASAAIITEASLDIIAASTVD